MTAMAISLYSATIPNYLQLLGAVAGLVDKAEAWCGEHRLAPDELIQARLAADMLPFAYQVKSTAVHSIGAIEGVRTGVFSPDRAPPPADFAGLKASVGHAVAALKAIDPAEVDAFAGRDVAFVFGERRMPFVAEDFLLSFSQPNFYFHATTAYDILRWKGLPIGKRDFTGRLRLKPAA
jgi:hypothetical protein